MANDNESLQSPKRAARCETCSAWARADAKNGVCRKVSPRVQLIPIPGGTGQIKVPNQPPGFNIQLMGSWPPTKPNDWCMEHTDGRWVSQDRDAASMVLATIGMDPAELVDIPRDEAADRLVKTVMRASGHDVEDGEPTFLIRGRDRHVAAATVETWASAAAGEDFPEEDIKAARMIAQEMMKWRPSSDGEER